MDRETRQSLLAEYRNGYTDIAAALEGITEAELDARSSPTDWTVREVVHHLADSEIVSATRLRRLIAEESPLIVGYDEDEYARRLHYDRPVTLSLDLFRAARLSNCELLDALTEEEWQRSGTHNQMGEYGVGVWLKVFTNHVKAHANQIGENRRLAAAAV